METTRRGQRKINKTTKKKDKKKKRLLFIYIVSSLQTVRLECPYQIIETHKAPYHNKVTTTGESLRKRIMLSLESIAIRPLLKDIFPHYFTSVKLIDMGEFMNINEYRLFLYVSLRMH